MMLAPSPTRFVGLVPQRASAACRPATRLRTNGLAAGQDPRARRTMALAPSGAGVATTGSKLEPIGACAMIGIFLVLALFG